MLTWNTVGNKGCTEWVTTLAQEIETLVDFKPKIQRSPISTTMRSRDSQDRGNRDKLTTFEMEHNTFTYAAVWCGGYDSQEQDFITQDDFSITCSWTQTWNEEELFFLDKVQRKSFLHKDLVLIYCKLQMWESCLSVTGCKAEEWSSTKDKNILIIRFRFKHSNQCRNTFQKYQFAVSEHQEIYSHLCLCDTQNFNSCYMSLPLLLCCILEINSF